jgi:protein tyrosine phosphatase
MARENSPAVSNSAQTNSKLEEKELPENKLPSKTLEAAMEKHNSPEAKLTEFFRKKKEEISKGFIEGGALLGFSRDSAFPNWNTSRIMGTLFFATAGPKTKNDVAKFVSDAVLNNIQHIVALGSHLRYNNDEYRDASDFFGYMIKAQDDVEEEAFGKYKVKINTRSTERRSANQSFSRVFPATIVQSALEINTGMNTEKKKLHVTFFSLKDNEAFDLDAGVSWSYDRSRDDYKEMLWQLYRTSRENCILVHCAAGVGRTGFFILMHEVLGFLDYSPTFSGQDIRGPILDILARIRTTRSGLVVTVDQFLAAIGNAYLVYAYAIEKNYTTATAQKLQELSLYVQVALDKVAISSFSVSKSAPSEEKEHDRNQSALRKFKLTNNFPQQIQEMSKDFTQGCEIEGSASRDANFPNYNANAITDTLFVAAEGPKTKSEVAKLILSTAFRGVDAIEHIVALGSALGCGDEWNGFSDFFNYMIKEKDDAKEKIFGEFKVSIKTTTCDLATVEHGDEELIPKKIIKSLLEVTEESTKKNKTLNVTLFPVSDADAFSLDSEKTPNDYDDYKETLWQLYQTSRKERILVHCSGGVGRTGFFIFMLEVLKLLDASAVFLKPKDMKDKVLEIIARIRKERPQLIENDNQFSAAIVNAHVIYFYALEKGYATITTQKAQSCPFYIPTVNSAAFSSVSTSTTTSSFTYAAQQGGTLFASSSTAGSLASAAEKTEGASSVPPKLKRAATGP